MQARLNIMSNERKRYYRKHVPLLDLIMKIKLWPARSGRLHGIKEIVPKGPFAEITTHCGENFIVYNSKNCRANRWIRNKWAKEPCPKCKIPGWKLEKYSNTFFSQHYGSSLKVMPKSDV